MSSDDLNLFSYEVLGLVGRNGAGAHDLRRMVRRGRFFDWAGESRYYVEPKRLARLEYLEARREPGRTRERTVYTLTQKGLDALRAWAREPARFTPIKSELNVRLLLTDLVGEADTRASVLALREDLADLRARLDEAEASSRSLPHRRKYLALNILFVRRLLDLHEELVEEVEREFSDQRGESAGTRLEPRIP
jgi:DNA-binding PadR family transcriptional regulator